MNYLVVVFILLSSFLSALEQEGSDFFLYDDSEFNIGPEILGIQFGKNETFVLNAIKEQGLVPMKQIEEKKPQAVMKWLIQGVPKGFVTKKGTMELIFFKKRLVQMRILFDPSYESFLLLRGQFFHSLGTRFALNRKEEAMDHLLRAYLSNLGTNALNNEAEAAILRSLEKGETFWFYEFKDKANELFITLSYRAKKEKKGGSSPEIELYYGWIEGVELKDKFNQEQTVIILPE